MKREMGCEGMWEDEWTAHSYSEWWINTKKMIIGKG